MSNDCFLESGMEFSFPKGQVIALDKQKFFLSLENVKACDFVVLLKVKFQERLYFIEAKSSAPAKEEPLNSYFKSVHAKYNHSLLLYTAALFNRTSNILDEWPEKFKTSDNLKLPVHFVLVVKNHKREWLMTLQDKMNFALRDITNAFFVNGVVVYNEEGAQKRGIVVSKS